MKYCLALYLILCLSAWARAQETPGKLIDLDYNQATITTVASDLSAKTGYHFYYDPAQFDSLRVTLTIRQQTLSSVLYKMFDKTNYHFVITGEQEVILTKNLQISMDVGQGDNNPAPNLAESPGNETEQQKITPGATSENKLYSIGNPNSHFKGRVTLAGYIRDASSGEAVIGTSIYEPETRTRVTTDQFGYYSITLPAGRYVLSIRAPSMKDTRRQVALYGNGNLNIDMQQQVIALKEVKISADKVANVRSTEMGVAKLDVKSIKQVPTVFGEADILRVVLTLPGVETVGEASTGFNVRGGSADQNLILLNGSTIYNPSHFFGFFSAFDPDLVQSIELYKSSIPEKYGGRLSSVLDITERDGNSKKFTGSAGIGLLTSRLNIEGPIQKDKTSFIFGARTTYADWLLKALPSTYKNSSASFYDLDLNIAHHIDDHNTLYLSGYLSHDGFRLNSDTDYSYGNRNALLKWKHNFSNKLFGVVAAGVDNYGYNISSRANPVNAYKFGFDITQFTLKTDFTYYISPKHTLSFGLSSIHYKIDPGSNEPLGAASQTAPVTIPAERALESTLYIGDKYDITQALSASLGLRYSLYNYLGPQLVRQYAPGVARISGNAVDSTYHGNGVINTYGGPEVRASLRYIVNDDVSLKAGYNTLRQYINLLSNTTAISPTDIWKLADPNIKPQTGDQISLGVYRNFASNTIETSIEGYYKHMSNYLDYRSGATLVLNPHIETDVVETKGKAYGIEFLVKKTAGQLNGWISYTYSRILLKEDDPGGGIPINGGNWYPSNYDKPHALNLIGNYRFTHRYSFSVNTVYSTGRPITYPIGEYYYDGAERVLYSDRNQYRIPDYFRMDISVNMDGNHKVHQKFHNSWTFGIYNVTGRNNAYSTYFVEQGGNIQGYQLSIFAHPIPFVNYNIRF
ncbi:MAG: carboxypeptidase-like regulatory domain-containing protein [Bacteroidetes bacterium]|nr:carboxypeptidase-like regulatory domain-containing protein [Bacteroidota bacterium]